MSRIENHWLHLADSGLLYVERGQYNTTTRPGSPQFVAFSFVSISLPSNIGVTWSDRSQ